MLSWRVFITDAESLWSGSFDSQSSSATLCSFSWPRVTGLVFSSLVVGGSWVSRVVAALLPNSDFCDSSAAVAPLVASWAFAVDPRVFTDFLPAALGSVFGVDLAGGTL